MMGSKTRARQEMERAGVPFVPGRPGPGLDGRSAAKSAEHIGYPVMLKAAAGGGGKGMRLVHQASELSPRYEAARSEAQRAFGDDEVYLEKAIVNPRHIEMQVLGRRIRQRHLARRARVFHPAPAPKGAGRGALPDRGRRHAPPHGRGRGACSAGGLLHQCGHGRISGRHRTKNFYFLEMNTRLQVEHPVTELITGLDLVHLQLRIAAGERLPSCSRKFTSVGMPLNVVSMRKTPTTIIFPSPGKVTLLFPPSGPGLRHDSGTYEGWTVPIDYDPLLAKIIGFGTDRKQAISRLVRALSEYFVGGIKTNIPFSSVFCRTKIHRGKTGYRLSRADCWPARGSGHAGRRHWTGDRCHCRWLVRCS